MSLYQRGETWMLEFWHEGTRHRERIGRKIPSSVAQDLATVRKAEILKGAAGIAKKDLYVEKAFEVFLKGIEEGISLNLGKKSRRPKTLQGYQENAKALLEVFKGKKLGKIRASQLRGYRAKRKSAPYAFNREMSFLSAVVNHCIKERLYSGENPTTGVERFEEKRRIRALTHLEFDQLSLAAASHIRPILKLAVFTGLRVKSQILTLRKSDVDLKDGFLTARASNAKNKEALRIPIRPELIESLREQMKISKCDWLFVHPRKPEKRLRSIRTAVKRARERARIAPFRIHDLRHTFATWLVQAGVDLPTIMALGGWKKLEMLEIYVNPSQEHQIEALNSVPYTHAESREELKRILREEEIVSRVPMKAMLRENESTSEKSPTYTPTSGVDKIPTAVND